MKNSIFGGIKDKLLRAADVDEENESMYDEQGEYDEYEEDEGYDYDSDQGYDSEPSYDFGASSTGFSSRSNQSSASFGAAEQGSGYGERYTRKANSNIYQMNNTPVSKVRRVVYFLLEDTADARNIADCMKAEDAVVLADMNKLSDMDSQCVLNFLDGVRYIFDSHIERIVNDVYLIVPKTIELAGDFYDQMSGVMF